MYKESECGGHLVETDMAHLLMGNIQKNMESVVSTRRFPSNDDSPRRNDRIVVNQLLRQEQASKKTGQSFPTDQLLIISSFGG